MYCQNELCLMSMLRNPYIFLKRFSIRIDKYHKPGRETRDELHSKSFVSKLCADIFKYTDSDSQQIIAVNIALVS
jgi:hypothetical protein